MGHPIRVRLVVFRSAEPDRRADVAVPARVLALPLLVQRPPALPRHRRAKQRHANRNACGLGGQAARGAGNAGATIAVVVNAEFREQRIQLRCGAKVASAVALPPRSVATFRWQEACG